MVDVSKLTAAQQKMVEEFKADGRLSADELARLEKAGVNEEILKELSSEFPDTGEVRISEPSIVKNKKPGFFKRLGNWFKDDKVPTWKKVLAGVGGALVGVAAVASGYGLVAAFGAGKVLAGAAVLGVGVGLTSCSNDIDQAVAVIMDTSALLKALNDKEAADAKRHEDIMNALNELIKQGNSLFSIVLQLQQQGAKLDTIIDLLVINGTKTDEIISILKTIGKTTSEIFAALGEMKLEQSQQTEILKSLVNNDKIKVDYLNQILEEIKKGNKLQANETNILNQILAKINDLSKNDDSSAELLNQILAQLTEFAKQQGDMDTKTHDLLETIIKNQDKMDDDFKAGITAVLAKLGNLGDGVKDALATIINNQEKYGTDIKQALADILAKLDSMDKADQERFEYIVPLLENLGSEGVNILNAIKEGNKITQAQLNAIIRNQNLTNAQLESLRQLVMKNNEIAQGTQDAVKDLKTQMADSQKAILDKIAAGNATLDEIKTILGDIKTGVDNNGIQIGDVKQFVNIIGTALDKLLAEVQGMRTETKQGILEILAKIPAGCNCKPTDLSAVIDLLNKLIDEVKKDPNDGNSDTSHEGILTDLDKYFQ